MTVDWAGQLLAGFLMLCCQVQPSLESSEDSSGMEFKMASLLVCVVPQLGWVDELEAGWASLCPGSLFMWLVWASSEKSYFTWQLASSRASILRDQEAVSCLMTYLQKSHSITCATFIWLHRAIPIQHGRHLHKGVNTEVVHWGHLGDEASASNLVLKRALNFQLETWVWGCSG